MIATARRVMGLDRAVVYTLSARLLNIVSSIGTVLLIMRFLSSAEQGYYYTLLSLVSLQVIFELGFSFVILQMAAHESARLKIGMDGVISGDENAHCRLASVFQLTWRWYRRAAVALAVILIPAGFGFFSLKHPGETNVAWQGPVVLAVLAVSGGFLMTPLCSFFEGCNQVREVAFVRMWQGAASLAASWGAIISGHALYAAAAVNLSAVAVGMVFLFKRRKIVSALLRYPVGSGGVRWNTEIWPFQWKMAVSWLSSYLTLQIFTPLLFMFRGPAEAGRMGLSLSIVGYIPILALSWVTPKAAPFGQLVKLRRYEELGAAFFRALRQSFALAACVSLACIGGVFVLGQYSPSIASRMESLGVFSLLVLAAVGTFLTQALAVYLRSFKSEPFLPLYFTIALLTTALSIVFVHLGGSRAIALIYFVMNGVAGVIWAVAIFRSFRLKPCSVPT